MQVEGVCAAPPGHPLSAKNVIVPSDLDNLPFIALTTEDETQFLVEAFFRGREQRRKIVAEAQMSAAACQFVAEGAGVSIVAPFSAMGFRDDEIVVRKLHRQHFFDLGLIVPTFRPIYLNTRHFI